MKVPTCNVNSQQPNMNSYIPTTETTEDINKLSFNSYLIKENDRLWNEINIKNETIKTLFGLLINNIYQNITSPKESLNHDELNSSCKINDFNLEKKCK